MNADNNQNFKENKVVRDFELKSIIFVFLIIFLFIFFIKSVVIDFYLVKSHSMDNTIIVDDVIVVSRLAYFIGMPDRLPFFGIDISPKLRIYINSPKIDDIVFFRNSIKSLENLEDRYIVKRVKGLPRSKVYYREYNGEIFFSIEKPELPNYYIIKIPSENEVVDLDIENIIFYKHIIENEGHKVEIIGNEIYIDNQNSSTYRIENNQYFLQGDNLSNSYDSRYFGLVPESVISGKILLILLTHNNSVSNRMDRFLKIPKDN